MIGRSNIHAAPSTSIQRGATIDATSGTVRLGRRTTICRWAILQSLGGSITIGDRSSVGDFCNLYGQGDISIGTDVQLASGVRVMTAEKEIHGGEPILFDAGNRYMETRVGDGAWLASNAVILAGVTIGESAVVGAGAVVTRDVPPWGIALGVPARVVGQRGR